MDHKNRWIDPRFAAATTALVAVILYGSLFPFQFHQSGNPWSRLIASAHYDAGYMDVLANVLLYVPLGILGARSLIRLSYAYRVCIVTLLGAALSLGIELAQNYDTGRDTGLWDLYANSTGVLLGALVVWLMPAIGRRRPFVLFLLACWMGYRLFPYSLEFHPPELTANMSWLRIAGEAVVTLAVALLVDALTGAKRSRKVFPLLAIAISGITFAMAGPRFAPETIWGAALAIPLWSAFLWRMPSRAQWIALLFAIEVAIDALRPFDFSSAARPFGMVPFLSFLNASRDTVIYEAFLKTFTYGMLLWTMMRAGWTLTRATATGAGLVLALRLAQVYLPGRSAEITDTLMVLGLAGVMMLLRENPAPGRLFRLGKRNEPVADAADGE